MIVVLRSQKMDSTRGCIIGGTVHAIGTPFDYIYCITLYILSEFDRMEGLSQIATKIRRLIEVAEDRLVQHIVILVDQSMRVPYRVDVGDQQPGD